MADYQVYPLPDIPKSEHPEPVTGGWKQGLPIAIDFGTSSTRVGYAAAIENGPSHNFYSLVSKYRDRKINRSYLAVGNDVYYDSAARQSAKSPFDGALVSNWDTVENILDYSFSKISVKSEGCVDNPVVMNEVIGCPESQRRIFNELLFEAYGVSHVAYGIDSLFSFHYNNSSNSSGLVISSGNESTSIVPVINGNSILSLAKRINYGGRLAANYLADLLALKYPLFPSKVTHTQSSELVKKHCYVSLDYFNEVSSFLDYEGLEKRDRVIQAPFTEAVVVEKSEEELAKIAEKRRENGRRLQEQAAKARLDKLIQKENDLNYYKEAYERLTKANKKDAKRILDSEGFKTDKDLLNTIQDLEKSIRRARKQDLGDEEESAPPEFPLVDTPDEELNDEQIKEKRKQRLLKANYDARIRAKEEKLLEEQRQKEEEQKDEEWRRTDLSGWIKDRRQKLFDILAARKEKKRLQEELSDRKSLASQMRMKAIAGLASNDSKKRRRGGKDDDSDDTFGANDDDWAVYRNIANVEDSDDEEEEKKAVEDLQKQLLEHDPNFTAEDTEESVLDWRKSLIHLFLRGPREFDPESQAQQNQIALNVERIRVPEVLFQPSIAGIDQAGIVEVCENILLRQNLGGDNNGVNTAITSNVFLTGGQAYFENFDERLKRDLRSILPSGTPLNISRAGDVCLDAWRGMAQWSLSDGFKESSVSKAEYLEMGSHYMKEHGLGNSLL